MSDNAVTDSQDKETAIAILATMAGYQAPRTRGELRGKGRGAGNTTRLLFEALYEISQDRPVYIASSQGLGLAQEAVRTLKDLCARTNLPQGYVRCLGVSTDRTFETRCMGLLAGSIYIDGPNPCTLAEALAAMRLRALVEDAMQRVQVGEAVIIRRTQVEEWKVGIVRPNATPDAIHFEEVSA